MSISKPTGVQMENRNFLTVTLLVSALAFTPLSATEIDIYRTNSQKQINSVSANIASILHKKGLDEDVSHAFSRELVEDEALFSAMLGNFLIHYPDISHEEVLEHLSTVALHRQNIQFDSYDHLVSMASKIQGKVLNAGALGRLRTISKLNQMMA